MNSSSSSIYEGKIKHQIKVFEDFCKLNNDRVLFVSKDISCNPRNRIINTGNGNVYFYYSHNKVLGLIFRVYNRFIANLILYRRIRQYIIKNNISFLYVRRSGTVDNEFIKFLKNVKSHDVRIIYDIPTFPYDGEMVKGSLQEKIDKKYRGYLRKYVDIVVTPSPQDGAKDILGMPYLVIQNGLIVSEIKQSKANRYEDDTIHAIAVSSLKKWHGYERFIKGLSSYYLQGGKRNIVFHIVGGDEDNLFFKQYINIINELRLEKHVVMHGNRFGEELDDIYDKCNIGISSLGLHRIGLNRSTALKCGEYISRGLPVYSSTIIDIFPPNYEYVGYDKPGEDPIDIFSFVSFYDSVYMGNDYNVVHEEIKNSATLICDMHFYMRPLLNWIEKENESND